MSKQKSKPSKSDHHNQDLESLHEQEDAEESRRNDIYSKIKNKDKKEKDAKNQMTIIQQINGFSSVAMNEKIAKKTIEDHKYLLEHVENRAAIAYFAVANRNQCLFAALKSFIDQEIQEMENLRKSRATEQAENDKNDKKESHQQKMLKHLQNQDAKDKKMEDIFRKMVYSNDFMTLIMYPELEKRRIFVHDAFQIAKMKDNTELKIAILTDPHMYIEKNDIEQLLFTKDDDMIDLVLRWPVQLHITNTGYRLVKIKEGQVNINQQTDMQLNDFVMIMVNNKRKKLYSASEIIFPHSKVVSFIERHKEFLKPAQVIKVLIMRRQFRLSLYLIIKNNVAFDIEFLTMAIEVNNWEVAFFLMSRYETQILQQAPKVVPAIVASFQKTPKFLKAKLHMAKKLLPKFTFDGFKSLVNNIRQKINETSLENNMFSHSPNPILSMCLTFEVLKCVARRSFSLSYDCIQLNGRLKQMMLTYIQEINKSKVMQILLFEKDYAGRDVLSIAVTLDLIDIIQQPKVVAEINRIYKSDYDCSGSLFEMSSAYQVLCQPMEDGIDHESNNRFYRGKNIKKFPQTDSNLKVFLNSMYSRLKGKVVVRIIYVIFIFQIKMIVMGNLMDIRAELPAVISSSEFANDASLNSIYENMAQLLLILQVLMLINLMFFITRITKLFILKKIGKTMNLANSATVVDGTMFVLGILSFLWASELRVLLERILQTQLNKPIDQVSYAGLLEELQDAVGQDFVFYYFAINFMGLILKCQEFLEYHPEYGPLQKIFGKLETDFKNFTKLYFLIVFMFALIGQILFGFDLKDYENLWLAFVQVLKVSIGVYRFDLYDGLETADVEKKKYFSDIYIFAIVASCKILLLNLVVSFITNAYTSYTQNAQGIYLTKIIGSRSQQSGHPNYGCYMANLTPADFVLVPFIPFAIIWKPSVRLNDMLQKIQYFILLFIYYIMFSIGCLFMAPMAYLKSLGSKFYILSAKSHTNKRLIINSLKLAFYLLFGLLIQGLNFLADSIYFWIFNLDEDVQTNEVFKEQSNMTFESFQSIMYTCQRFLSEKINSIDADDLVKILRRQMQVVPNLQYLLFNDAVHPMLRHQYREFAEKMRKQRLAQGSQNLMDSLTIKEQQQQVDEAFARECSDKIKQYNEIKTFLLNVAFQDKGKPTICLDILLNIMEELRKDRKIKMTIKDKNIDDYIMLNLEDIPPESEQKPFMKQVLKEKRESRRQMIVQITQLEFRQVMRMLKNTHGRKATMLNGDAFADKVDKLKKKIDDEEKVEQSKVLGGTDVRVKQQSLSTMKNFESSKDIKLEIANRKKDLVLSDQVLVDLDAHMDQLRKKLSVENNRIIKKIELFFSALRD